MLAFLDQAIKMQSSYSIPPLVGDLILAVMLLSEAVLFHREMMSSVGLMEMTTPHISLPTMNCSPSIASSYIERGGERDMETGVLDREYYTNQVFPASGRDAFLEPDHPLSATLVSAILWSTPR